jgi:hypothetical protein
MYSSSCLERKLEMAKILFTARYGGRQKAAWRLR